MPKDPAPSLADLLADEVDIASLSHEELAERRQALSDAARAAREGELTSEVTGLIAASVEAVRAIKDEQGLRGEAAATLIAEADAAMAALDETEAEPAEESEEGEEGETTEVAEAAETEETATADETATTEGETKEVAAAAKPKRALNREVRVPARQQPQRTTAQDSPSERVHLVATGEVRGVTAGHHFSDMREVNRAMFDRWMALRQTPRDGHPHLMTTVDYTHMYPPEQVLMGGDPYEVSEKINRYLEARHGGEEALGKLRVASGGVSGPAEPRYGQITFGMADRPLRDALPSFLAARGEIVFNNSPTLADVLLDQSAGAIGTVTSAQDVSGTTKDVQEISASTPTTVTVQAETMRWSQGNFADRFYPERTAAMMALGQVAYARHNDALRLTDIKNNCTLYTDTPAKFGAYRDLKRQFLGQTEELEDLVRDFNVPTICLMPEFVPAMMAADLVSQQPGDTAWNVTEESMRTEMEAWDPNVKIVWLKDSIRGRLSVSPSGQSPRSAGFDADVEWCLFPDGAFLFLDGGQLDLGILRDTVVSATNKFQTFYESWEALAALVSPLLCFWMTSSLCSDGNSQAAQAVNACSAENS